MKELCGLILVAALSWSAFNVFVLAGERASRAYIVSRDFATMIHPIHASGSIYYVWRKGGHQRYPDDVIFVVIERYGTVFRLRTDEYTISGSYFRPTVAEQFGDRLRLIDGTIIE